MAGHDYIDAMAYLSLAMAYQKSGQFEKADSLYTLGLEYHKSTSGLHYYKARNLLNINRVGDAKASLLLAQEWYDKGGKNARPYVVEFFAVYQEDLDTFSGLIGYVD